MVAGGIAIPPTLDIDSRCMELLFNLARWLRINDPICGLRDRSGRFPRVPFHVQNGSVENGGRGRSNSTSERIVAGRAVRVRRPDT